MKARHKFSIITPVHLWNDFRVQMFLRTINSLKAQTFKDFEWIVIDDGSTVPFIWDTTKLTGVKVKIRHKNHEERVVAYNEAFKIAEGEWFVLLDSDDEFVSDALEIMLKYIKKSPKQKMFNFGCIYHHKDGGARTRDSFKPKKKKVGHEQFGGGNIVNGTFIFKREVYETLGAYPETHLKDVDTTDINYGGRRDLFMGTPYDFSAAAQLEFPEIREYFMVDHENEPNKIVKELGNPWGQDYYLFYKYTRKYHSKPFDEHLYVVNPR
jgi:glycosyltransferase involved in cell wall biosynthesis